MKHFLLINLFVFAWNVCFVVANIPIPFNRTFFSPDFIFGAADSAYQVEGAWNENGKGPSIWDNFTQKNPSIIVDKSNGNVAIDFYNRYQEDLSLAKEQGFDAFRFSIAWSRILPKGSLRKGSINMAGIDFYNRLINEIKAQGLTPLATLFHWDTPQALEDEYLGFLSSKIVDDYLDYVDICFKYFGDRVKKWATINEPYSYAINGYDYGIFAPGRCSNPYICSAGNSSTEPYIVAHNLLLAHAAGANLYNQKYKAKQKGIIGFAQYTQWYVPYSKNREDVLAAKRAIDFQTGWFLHPVVYGDYPEDMKRLVGARLPKFTQKEKKMLIRSCDFIGINYYTAWYTQKAGVRSDIGAHTDDQVNKTQSKNGETIGPPTGSSFNYVVPWGLRELLIYVKQHYKNPIIYITECGMPDKNNATVQEGVKDSVRVYFYESHIKEMHKAIKSHNVKVKAFFAWSLHDNFEWYQGYTERYGINYIDYNDNLKRYPKDSALWFKKFLLK